MINKIKNLFKLTEKNKINKLYFILQKIFFPLYFLKYLSLIFISCAVIFVSAPKFFNYENKENILKETLKKNYNIRLNNYQSIHYKILPTPRLYIYNADLEFDKILISKASKQLIIPVKVNQLYNFDNLDIDNISVIDSDLLFELDNIIELLKYMKTITNKLLIKSSELAIIDKNRNLIKLNKIYFSNHKKNHLALSGFLYDQRFQIKYLKDVNHNKFNLEIPNAGINGKFLFSNNSNFTNFEGDAKIQILKNNIKFSFKKDDKIKIYKSSLRNKFLNTTFDGVVKVNPYFDLDLVFKMNQLDMKRFIKNKKPIALENISKINPKINGKFEILLKNKNFKNNYIKEAKILIFLENGNIKLKKSLIKFDIGNLILSGSLFKYRNYEKLSFNLIANIVDYNKFLKNFDVVNKKNNKSIDLDVEGFFTLPSGKITFDKISSSNLYSANEEELLYFKKKFNKILINSNLKNIFNYNNVGNFIQSIVE